MLISQNSFLEISCSIQTPQKWDISLICCVMAQAINLSPTTAGVPSSRLGHSMWASWWTKWGLDRFFSGFSRFHLPKMFSFHHFSTLISFIAFHFTSSDPVMMRQELSVSFLHNHRPSIWGLHCISSLDPALCRTRVEILLL